MAFAAFAGNPNPPGNQGNRPWGGNALGGPSSQPQIYGGGMEMDGGGDTFHSHESMDGGYSNGGGNGDDNGNGDGDGLADTMCATAAGKAMNSTSASAR